MIESFAQKYCEAHAHFLIEDFFGNHPSNGEMDSLIIDFLVPLIKMKTVCEKILFSRKKLIWLSADHPKTIALQLFVTIIFRTIHCKYTQEVHTGEDERKLADNPEDNAINSSLTTLSYQAPEKNDFHQLLHIESTISSSFGLFHWPYSINLHLYRLTKQPTRRSNDKFERIFVDTGETYFSACDEAIYCV